MGAWIGRAGLVAAFIAAGFLSAPASAQTRSRLPTVGYIPAFKGLDTALAAVDLSQYTHLNLAFVNPDRTGAIHDGARFACAEDGKAGMLRTSALRKLADQAHRAGSKLLISLGGGVIPSCSGDWEVLLQPDNRAKLVERLVAAVDRHGLDGIDVDIEGVLLTRIDRAGNYTPFIAALSQALKARGKLLTCATASYEGGMVPTSSVPYFDLVAIMTYDAIGPTWGPAGSEHSTVEQARTDIQLGLDRGVARDRLILGVPFYGYGFGGFKANYAFRDILAEFPGAAPITDVIGTRCAGCRYITFNGLATLTEKARLARERAGGVMVWEISQDTNDHRLIRSINGALNDAVE